MVVAWATLLLDAPKCVGVVAIPSLERIRRIELLLLRPSCRGRGSCWCLSLSSCLLCLREVE